MSGILNPKGIVTYIERMLLFDTLALMLIVVVPVILMSFDFIYHYREKNHTQGITKRKVEYKPEWAHSYFLEGLWWGIPCLIIFVLALITWNFTHKLDPYRTFNYPGTTVKVQVVALPWKWLFIYPDYNIASVNHLVIPENHQIEFFITADNVPMSSFFIPQLGGQIYAMAGMQTKLHLIPSELASIEGFNSQYNGDGFANMRFTVDVRSAENFSHWVQKVSNDYGKLGQEQYANVRKPQLKASIEYFSKIRENLFNEVLHSYMSYEHPKW